VTDRESFLAASFLAATFLAAAFLAADFWAADFFGAFFLFLGAGAPVQLNEAFNCYSLSKQFLRLRDLTYDIFVDAIPEPILRLKYWVRQKIFTSAS